jgi:hypothetical protein
MRGLADTDELAFGVCAGDETTWLSRPDAAAAALMAVPFRKRRRGSISSAIG